MLIKEIQFQAIPYLKPSDTVYQALQIMQDQHVKELAVADAEGVYLGIISELFLLEQEEDAEISNFEFSLERVAVKVTDHFLQAVEMAARHNLSIIPVVDAQNFLFGTIATHDLLGHVASFMHLEEPGAMVILEVDPNHYSFSEISKIVESNDAQITQFNTTRNIETGNLLVTLKINKLEISDIVSSFQRYDYNVKNYFGEEIYTNEIKSNYENLMNYLNI